MTDANRYDVVILGGGLAGLTLSLHLLKRRPGTRILVIEKKRHPVDEAAHKVGESSVEIGAHYFTNVLGQMEHFRTRPLAKLGLRYFFSDGDKHDIATRTELGGNVFFPSRSWQIDRGRFENHLGRRAIELGAEFAHGATVASVGLGKDRDDHVVTWKDASGSERTSRARWVVD